MGGGLFFGFGRQGFESFMHTPTALNQAGVSLSNGLGETLYIELHPATCLTLSMDLRARP